MKKKIKMIDNDSPGYYVGGIKPYKDLTDEESLALTVAVVDETNVEKKLEFIFSYIGFDEEGYLRNNYDNEGYGKYIVNDDEELILYRFIERKKTEVFFQNKKQWLEKKLKNISLPKDKFRLLNAHLKDIELKVHGNQVILYGFTQSELCEVIRYFEPEVFAILRRVNQDIHSGPYRGALLKGEGIAYSQFKKYIEQIIDEISEPLIHLQKVLKKETFDDFLIGKSKKLLPFLIKNFKNEKPREVVFMIFALINLGFFLETDLNANQTQLCNAVSISIKNVSRQALVKHFPKYNNIDALQSKIVTKFASIIKEAFDSIS